MAFELRRRQELNILLIGETGVGKSTLINSFANYIKFRTLDEAAEQRPPLCLISTHFKEKKIKVDVEGSSLMLEGTEATKAGTQIPATYLFQNGFWYLRFIDTPGICDPRGEKKDRENFKCLSTYLSKYFREIHGICILVKSDQQKLTPYFESMIDFLLNYFNKDAIKNTVFCFTRTRYCNYEDCQAEDLLSDMFKEKDIDIKMSEQNSYYVDNEAFKYLCAKYVGVRYTDNEVDFFRTSWENSEKELCRMLYHFEKLDPHNTGMTASLHDAQNLLSRLTRPIAYVAVNIQENIMELEKQKEQLKANSKGFEELREEIVIENVVIKPEKFPSPRLVCRHASCQNHEKAEDFCVLVQSSEFRSLAYKFWFLRTSCDKCSCFYWHHTIDTYKMKKEVVKIKIRSFAERLIRETEEINSILFTFANVSEFVKRSSFSTPIDQFDVFMKSLVAEDTRKPAKLKFDMKIKAMGFVEEKYKMFCETATGSLFTNGPSEKKSDDILTHLRRTAPNNSPTIIEFLQAEDDGVNQLIQMCETEVIVDRGNEYPWFISLLTKNMSLEDAYEFLRSPKNTRK